MTDLASRWAGVAGSTSAAVAVGVDLIRRWSQPHRHYHDVTHLVAVLDAIDRLLADGAPADDADAVRLAAWFHDAVYDGVPGDDERASAALAHETLPALGIALARVSEISRLVLLTVDHASDADDRDGALLCDADLAILGADPASYADYVQRVRRDYAHVNEDDFRTGRTTVLHQLLALDPLYRTAAGQRCWQEQATANIRAELTSLSR